MSEQPTMPLSMLAPGETATIHRVNGSKKLRQRLQDLGMNPGAQVRVLKNQMPDPMIVAVKEDGRLALGHSMTHHILVTAVQKQSTQGDV